MISLPARLGSVNVQFATAADTLQWASPIDAAPDAQMARWHFVRVQVGGNPADLHTLGHMHGDVYITSPMRVHDSRRCLVRTRSGRVYELASRGNDDDPDIKLIKHLLHALLTWRYVRLADLRGIRNA